MKTVNFLLLLLTLGAFSCSKDDSLEAPNKTEQTKYTFEKIEFLNTSQSEKKEFSENKVDIVFYNYNSSKQTISDNPISGIYDISQFSGIDTIILNNIIDLPLIAIPINIENDVFFGEKKWAISNDIKRNKPNLFIENSIQLKSNKKLTLTTKLFYRELKTNFKLTLMNETNHKEQIFEGKWTGCYLINAKSEAVFTDL